MQSAPVVLISEAARLLGVSTPTLRAWERSGRLVPQRTLGGVRIYERSQIERLAIERAAAKVGQ